MEIDHLNFIRSDNRIENLQLLTRKQNIEKSHNKPVISINIETGDKYIFDSIKEASEALDIGSSNISRICKNKQKKSISKKDGCKYIFIYDKVYL